MLHAHCILTYLRGSSECSAHSDGSIVSYKSTFEHPSVLSLFSYNCFTTQNVPMKSTSVFLEANAYHFHSSVMAMGTAKADQNMIPMNLNVVSNCCLLYTEKNKERIFWLSKRWIYYGNKFCLDTSNSYPLTPTIQFLNKTLQLLLMLHTICHNVIAMYRHAPTIPDGNKSTRTSHCRRKWIDE